MASKGVPSKSVTKKVEAPKKPVVHRIPRTIVEDPLDKDPYDDYGDYIRAKKAGLVK